MSGSNQEIFNKISSLEERHKIFNDMIKMRVEVFCKGTSDEVFKLSCERLSADQKMICNFSNNESFRPSTPSSLVCQFSLSGEKYFFKSTLDFRIKSYLLDLSGDLFHLQRRQSYRIRIPTSTRSTALVTHNDTQEKLQALPFDLSTGGCRLCFTKENLSWKLMDKVTLELKIGQREVLVLPGVIRYIKAETQPKASIHVGLQFEGITSVLEKSLFSITMELYREFFSHLE